MLARKQVAVVGYQHHRALEVLQRHRQRLAHLQVEVVGGLVEQQQVGPLPDDQRQRQPRLLAAGEAPHRGIDHVAAEIEAAEKVAQVLLACPPVDCAQMLERRLVGAQLLELVLREIADSQSLALHPLPSRGHQLTGQQLDQRGLARAVGAQQPDARASGQREVDAR